MDAPKTKKEASEAKAEKSLFCISGFHFCIPLTDKGSIANFNFSCQYFFCKCPTAYDVNLSTGLGHPDGCFNRAGFFCWKEEACRAPMAGRKKKILTRRIQLDTVICKTRQNNKGRQRGTLFFGRL
jgi:hypothetical protein